MTNARAYSNCTGGELLVEARLATEENALSILHEVTQRLEASAEAGVLDLNTNQGDSSQMTLL